MEFAGVTQAKINLKARSYRRDANGSSNRIHCSEGLEIGSELRLFKRNELPPFLVPQGSVYTSQTLKDSDPPDRAELRMIPQYIRQPIARDSAAQMMNVVDSDIRREPAQDAW